MTIKRYEQSPETRRQALQIKHERMTMTNTNKHTGFYLITPSALQSMFVLAADRQYFSRPVPVLPVPYTGDPGDGLTIVFDPTRDQTYPVSRKHLCYPKRSDQWN